MQTIPTRLLGERERQGTIAAHTQAVERAIQVMHTHMHELLTLEDMACAAYLSPFHFNRVFRHLTGVPPGEFLSALRFQTARFLLLSTPLSVTDICFEVGYTSTGSFTSRFTQMVGLSPRVLRQRARAFEPEPVKTVDQVAMPPALDQIARNILQGRISAPATFQGTIYIGLFPGPVPQGAPVRCCRLSQAGAYTLTGVPDGLYHLRAAAFPLASDLRSCLLPGEKILLGNNAGPLLVSHGRIVGDPNLILHPPRLTDPPLVMGLPLL